MVTGLSKRFGKEPVSVELNEIEMHSLLKACHHWNKKLYAKLKTELIDEAVKEGYEITFVTPSFKFKCPKCNKEIKI